MASTGSDNHEPQFTRLIPTSSPPEKNNYIPWVIVLSDWSQVGEALKDRVGGIFRQPDERAMVPTVIIVDDLGSPLADHEELLNDLAKAGAILLTPQSQEETETIRRAPLVFVATQLAAIQAHSAVAGPLSPGVPSSPDAYKEFAKAVTRLSPVELEDLIEGRRGDDWRYST